jgi:hypothetical protein
VLVALVWAGLGQIGARGQQTPRNLGAGSTNMAADLASVSLPERSSMQLRLTEPKDTNTLQYVVSKTTTIQVSGPLVRPLKATSASDFGHRIFSLVNPFSREAPNVPAAASGPVSTRAWSTIVGYSPGRSAFPDGAWHEPPHLDLFSVRLEKQP